MEYVDGEPIDLYCDRRTLTVEQRLRLFVTVCAAVHRAHQQPDRPSRPQAVEHPGHAGRRSPSCSTSASPSCSTTATIGCAPMAVHAGGRARDDAGLRQLRSRSAASRSPPPATSYVARRAAVRAAHRLQALRRARRSLLGELERAICEDTPPSLSDRDLGGRGDFAHDGDADRRTALGEHLPLRRELRGDLDNIVMMAMRKEPERRYSSVEQFSADVSRYLDRMPVLARADSWGYRATKFVRRHALTVSLAASFLVLLLGFTITVYMQSQRIARERDVAQAERQRAESERERVQAVQSFLLDLLPHGRSLRQGRRRGVTARQMLDNGAVRIKDELRQQPDLQATVLDTIGSAYLGLGLPEQAQPLIEQGPEVRRELYGEDSIDVARSLYSLNRVFEKKGDLDKVGGAGARQPGHHPRA